MEGTDREVLATIERDVLRPEVVERAIETALASLHPSPSDVEVRQSAFKADLAQIEEELARLTQAIARGGELPSLVAEIQTREQRRTRVQQQLAALASLSGVGQLDARRTERQLRERLAGLQGLLAHQVGPARQILRMLLADRLVFTPREDETGGCYEFVGLGSLGRILTGIVLPKGVVAPTGFNHEAVNSFLIPFEADALAA